jgi:hypothetical protein
VGPVVGPARGAVLEARGAARTPLRVTAGGTAVFVGLALAAAIPLMRLLYARVGWPAGREADASAVAFVCIWALAARDHARASPRWRHALVGALPRAVGLIAVTVLLLRALRG